ncbi:protein PIF-like [Patella vulgata]|uniref:protein PIF-like n=1 Tax=Patella vulgata TaxID=6465 RepID=UPI0024A7C413|nr:protein PIF-like [Patella vulgata]
MNQMLLVFLVSVVAHHSLAQQEIYEEPGPCFGCVMRNGIGYLPGDTCETYVQCQFTASGVLRAYTNRICGFGTFWDRSILTCNHISSLSCTKDPCAVAGAPATYKSTGNCSEYYQCINKVSTPRTCPEGQSYNDDTRACLDDPSCKTNITDTCDLTAIANEPCYYNQESNGDVYRQPCGPGTTYDQDACGCVLADPSSCPAVCKHIVDIDFNGPEPGEYDNFGAVIDNGVAYFNGNSSVKILRLANADFRKRITILTRYKPEFPATTFEQAVVANGDCNEASTVAIVANGSDTQFVAKSPLRLKQQLTTASSGEWREVVYEIKSNTFTGKDGSATDSQAFVGNLEVTMCAFQVGHGEGYLDFRGWVDYVSLSL